MQSGGRALLGFPQGRRPNAIESARYTQRMHLCRYAAIPLRRIWRVRSGRTAGLTGAAFGVLTAVVLISTSPLLPMVWDEGDALDRADAVRAWLSALRNQDHLPRPLTFEGLRRGWPFTTVREGHPAFYGIVIAMGREAAPSFLDPLTRYRFGPMLLFAIACGVVAAKVTKHWGWPAAATAVLGILLQPRLFAHAHFASFDGPLTSCWLLTWTALPFPCRPARREPSSRIRSRVGFLVLCGAALGLTMGCKASGLLAVFPVTIALVLIFGRRAWIPIFIVLATAAAVFFAVNPPLWMNPVEGLNRFLYLNLHRADQPGLNISTWFAGRMYNLDHPLPWYNTILWTAIAVPVPILVFFLIGLISILISRSRRREGVILGLFWLTLVLARTVPGTPPHDGIRQFLPAFGILGIIAGIGLSIAYRWCRFAILRGRHGRSLRPGLGIPCAWLDALLRKCNNSPMENSPSQSETAIRAAAPPKRLRVTAGVLSSTLVLFYLSSGYSLFMYTPQWLSFYNRLIGGVGGAWRAGFEATYYWDALDDEALRWLSDHASPGGKVFLATYPKANLRRLRAWRPIYWDVASDPEQADWYVVQNRPSGWSEIDRRLFFEGRASFEKRIRRLGPASPVLLKVFSRREYLRLSRAATQFGSGGTAASFNGSRPH